MRPVAGNDAMPSLISVRGFAEHVMVDRETRRKWTLRPLKLPGPTCCCRRQRACGASRNASFVEGRARTGEDKLLGDLLQGLIAEFAETVVSPAHEPAGDRETGPVVAGSGGDAEVVSVVG